MFKSKPTNSLTYLAASSEFHGNMHVDGDLRVDGVVHGNVDVRGDLEICPTGLIEGSEVRARNLIVHGVLKARVIAEGKLTLSKSARLEGDVNATELHVEPGALYVGYIETIDAKALSGLGSRPELIAGRDEL